MMVEPILKTYEEPGYMVKVGKMFVFGVVYTNFQEIREVKLTSDVEHFCAFITLKEAEEVAKYTGGFIYRTTYKEIITTTFDNVEVF